MATAPRPILLIAGGGEEEANRGLRDAAPGTTELWELPDTAHVGALRTHRDAWEARVTDFFDRALLGAAG